MEKTPFLSHRPATVGPPSQASEISLQSVTLLLQSLQTYFWFPRPGPFPLSQGCHWILGPLPSFPISLFSASNLLPLCFLFSTLELVPPLPLLSAGVPPPPPAATLASRADYSNPTTNFPPLPDAFRPPSWRGACRVVATASGIPTL